MVVVLAIGAGLVFWKSNVGAKRGDFSSISQQEIELLLADAAKINPLALKRLAETPELKQKQLEDLKQLLAFASEAQRTGLANAQPNRQELANIEAEVIAVNYDREINADKGPMPPFGFITEDQVKAFWGEGEQPAPGFFQRVKDTVGLGKQDANLGFERFLNTKVELLKASNPQMKDREISEEERQQARDFYAKVQIYADEYQQKADAGELSQEFQDKVNLQVKLQKAQFLARLFSEKAVEQTKVTDEEVDKYIADNPQYQNAEKKQQAEAILARAKGGEDFAALANEFSEDPGNKGGEEGALQGGLYENVAVGQMVKPFEDAAMALEPGQVAEGLVESDFGYHIIKLERKGETEGPTGDPAMSYDVRHILISTGYKDPEDPMGREMPVKRFIRQKLETEKEKQFIDDVVARNNIQVPEDFNVPTVSDEDIQEMLKKQQGPMDLHTDDDGHDHSGDAGAPPPPAPANN